MHIAHNSFIKKIMYIRKLPPFVDGHMYMDMDVIIVSTKNSLTKTCHSCGLCTLCIRSFHFIHL